MRRQFYGLMVSVCLVFALIPAVRAADPNIVSYSVTGGNIYFDKSTHTVTDCDLFVRAAIIPDMIAGVRVTSIGREAFDSCSSLTSVTIPNSVTSIDDYAFWSCENLTSVTIPNSVTSIGREAFRYCYGLTSVTIPDSVTSIGVAAFERCGSLTSVTIPNSVTSISHSTFYHCSSLTSVTIPGSVTSIGEAAFGSCSSLTSVNISNSVVSIGTLAFYSCSSLTDVYYNGTESEYKSKLLPNVSLNNDDFLNAAFHFQDASNPPSPPGSTLPNTAAKDNTTIYGTAFLILSALTLTVWALGRRKQDGSSTS